MGMTDGNDILAIDKFHKKRVKNGSFLPHLDSAPQKQIYIDTTYNEHLRPIFIYLMHLVHVTSYKLNLLGNLDDSILVNFNH